jgi:hypothetical protein
MQINATPRIIKIDVKRTGELRKYIDEFTEKVWDFIALSVFDNVKRLTLRSKNVEYQIRINGVAALVYNRAKFYDGYVSLPNGLRIINIEVDDRKVFSDEYTGIIIEVDAKMETQKKFVKIHLNRAKDMQQYTPSLTGRILEYAELSYSDGNRKLELIFEDAHYIFTTPAQIVFVYDGIDIWAGCVGLNKKVRINEIDINDKNYLRSNETTAFIYLEPAEVNM